MNLLSSSSLLAAQGDDVATNLALTRKPKSYTRNPKPDTLGDAAIPLESLCVERRVDSCHIRRFPIAWPVKSGINVAPWLLAPS